jgi:hypothetical protein
MAYSLRVVLREPRWFFAGDNVVGVIVVSCHEPFLLNSLTVYVSGELEYGWQHGHSHVRHSESLGKGIQILFTSVPKVQFNPGEMTFPFAFKLNRFQLPSAELTDLGGFFEISVTNLGSIKYTLGAFVDDDTGLFANDARREIAIGGLRERYLQDVSVVRSVKLDLGQAHALTALIPKTMTAGCTFAVRFEGSISTVCCVVKTRISLSSGFISTRSHWRETSLGTTSVVAGVATWQVPLDLWPSIEHECVTQRNTIELRCGAGHSGEIDVVVWPAVPSPPPSTPPLSIPPIHFPICHNTVPHEPLQFVTWQQDEDCPTCTLCSASFGAFTWRHHCRWCGCVVCNSCSPSREVKRLGDVLQRVCTKCTTQSRYFNPQAPIDAKKTIDENMK